MNGASPMVTLHSTPPTTPPAATVTLRPGRRLIGAAMVLMLLGLPAFRDPAWGWVVFGLAIGLALIACRDGRAAAAAVAGIRVRRRLPGMVGRGLAFSSTLLIEHDHRSPLWGAVRDRHPPTCEPEWHVATFGPIGGVPARLELDLDCRIPCRGRHTFGPVWLRVVGPAGLMEAQRPCDCPGTIQVLPETFASRGELVKETGASMLLLERTLRARELGAGTEFVSLLPFRDGDDPRRIDWRATARHRALVIRHFQIERHRDVVIALDRGRLMGAATDTGSKLDCTVDSALNLARVVLHSGDRCGLVAFDNRVRGYLAPMAGPSALSRLVETAADLACDFHETDFLCLFTEMQRRLTKRCLLVVLTDIGDMETSRTQATALARLARRHLVLLAAVRTPLLGRVIRTPANDLAAGARQAVALNLLRDRGRTLVALARDGIHPLDVEPGQLTLPLINRFIELRGRNLL